MGKKWYGSITNRIEEGRQSKIIEEGMDVNIYYWSDVHCKYVTKVIDQKHIFVHDYEVCADHDKTGGMGHQNWKYFKTIKEEKEYLKKYFPNTETENIIENEDEEWVFRYNSWHKVIRFTQKTIDEIKACDGWCRLFPKNEKEKTLLDVGKEVIQYQKITEGVSIGRDIKNYYYDWTF